MKVVENSPQNPRNCTIFKNFLGGACPQTPLAKARSFAACISKISEILKLGPPPPLRNPAYAPANRIIHVLNVHGYMVSNISTYMYIRVQDTHN